MARRRVGEKKTQERRQLVGQKEHTPFKIEKENRELKRNLSQTKIKYCGGTSLKRE